MNFAESRDERTGLTEFSTHRGDFAAYSLQIQQREIADAIIDCAQLQCISALFDAVRDGAGRQAGAGGVQPVPSRRSVRERETG
jgi:hypothetical protein